MLEHLIDQASSYSRDIDNLFFLIMVTIGVWLVVVEAVFFYLLFKFKKKSGVKAQYVTGDKDSEKRWITIPHVLVILCDVVIIAATILIWMKIKQDLPTPDLKIRIVAQQWAWTFVQPGRDGKLDTEDDIITIDKLNIELGKIYHFDLQATDVIHSFSVPSFRLKQDAVPGRSIVGWFEAIKTGEYDIQCAEMCGIGHGLMAARLYIRDEAEHQIWMTKQTLENEELSIKSKLTVGGF